MQERKDYSMAVRLEKIMAARNCKKKKEFMGLNMIEPREPLDFQNEMLRIQGENFGRPEAPQKVKSYIEENLQQDWSLCGVQHMVLKEEETAYQMRLASFFIGKNCVASNISWSVPVSMRVGSLVVSEVYGVCHAVCEEKEAFSAYILKNGKSPYSPKARKLENKPEFAPELIATYLALRETYGENLKVYLVYTKRDKDSAAAEFKPTQIITADFSNTTVGELQRRLKEILQSERESADCTNCRYQAFCKGLDVRRIENEESSVRPAQPPIFTDSQRQVVDFNAGTCAVYAVPGAGKTTTLVYRMCRLLESGVAPKNILFATFTNKAADEIRERAKKILGTDNDDEIPDIYTYNGLGWKIIRDHPEIVGDLKLLTPMDEKRLLLKCIDGFQKPLKGYSYRYIEGPQGLINLLKRSFKALEDDPEREEQVLFGKGHSPQEVKELKADFQEELKKESYIGFDDQITLAKKILMENPEILKAYARQWQYIMADEFQDSSQDNVDLLYMLADAGEKNLVVVGDADQSIFEWRKGSPKHLLRFREHYAGCKQIYMMDNFRSVRKILDASNLLISNNSNRIRMHMVAHKESNAVPYRVTNCPIDSIPVILDMLKKKRFQYGDIALISRNNAALGKLKVILDKQGIESISPADYLIHDAVFIIIKDVLDLYYQGFSKDDSAFYRYLLSQGVKIPQKEDPSITLYDNLIKQGYAAIDTHSMESLLQYAVEQEEDSIYPVDTAMKTLFELFLLIENCPIDTLVEKLAGKLQIEEKHPATTELTRCIEFQRLESAQELQEYLEWMVEFNDETKIEYNTTPNKVNLMTAHSSKGKEFPAVIILQAEDFKASEEERRLLYVAMTRAKKTLFLLESPYQKCEMMHEIEYEVVTTCLA